MKVQRKKKPQDVLKNYTKVLGVDPGITGGLAYFGNNEVKAILMPSKTVKGWKVDEGKTVKTSIKVIDSKAVLDFIQSVAPDIICIEMVNAWGTDAKQSILTSGKRFGVLQSIFTLLDIPIIEVYSKTWQKAVLGKEDKDKNIAIAYVKEHYPHIDLQPGRCTTDQNGITDALCIGKFGLEWCKKSMLAIPV